MLILYYVAQSFLSGLYGRNRIPVLQEHAVHRDCRFMCGSYTGKLSIFTCVGVGALLFILNSLGLILDSFCLILNLIVFVINS